MAQIGRGTSLRWLTGCDSPAGGESMLSAGPVGGLDAGLIRAECSLLGPIAHTERQTRVADPGPADPCQSHDRRSDKTHSAAGPSIANPKPSAPVRAARPPSRSCPIQ